MAEDTAKSPPPRRWFKRRSDGQLGYLVERHGKEMIKLDRPAEDAVEPIGARWEPVSSDRPVSRQQVARIAFGADRDLCRMLALHGEARKEWASLTDRERINWVANGPPAEPPLRRELWDAVMGVFPGAV